MVAAASVLQHALPVGARNIWLQLDPNGTVQGFHIVALGMSMHGTRTEERYAALLWQHLQPLFLRLAEQTRVAPKILWGNTARRLDHILAQAVARVAPAPRWRSTATFYCTARSGLAAATRCTARNARCRAGQAPPL